MNNKFLRAVKVAMLCKNSKGIMIFSVACFFIAPVLMIVSDEFFFLGGILTVYSWMFFTQFLALVDLSEAAAASPLKKYMATTMQDIITGVGALISLGSILVSTHIRGANRECFLAYAFICIFLIYFGVVYKWYWGGLITVCLLFGAAMPLTLILTGKIELSVVTLDVVGGVAIVFGWAVGLIFRHALYKLPMAPIMRKSLERQCR